MGDLQKIPSCPVHISSPTKMPNGIWEVKIVSNSASEQFFYSIDGGHTWYTRNISLETVQFTIDATEHGFWFDDQSVEQGSDVIIREVPKSENPFFQLRYEQGTWVPDCISISPSYSVGFYTRIANQIFIQFRLEFGITSSSEDFIITGLPFTIGNSGDSASTPVGYNNKSRNDIWLPKSGQKIIHLRSNAGTNISHLTYSQGTLMGSITYLASD